MEYIYLFTNLTFLVTVLAAFCAFATVLTIAMPILARDRMGQRLREMAIERDKMRAGRIAEMSANERQGARLRQTPKGFMQQIVDQLNLRAAFDSSELREKLKRAGLRGQAPLVAYLFFRVAAPIVVFIAALVYFFVFSSWSYPPWMKVVMSIGAGLIGSYLPNIFIRNLSQKRG